MHWGDGFEVETLINVRIAKAGLRVTEVPSFEAVRHFGASNLNAFSDGLRVLRTIHAERNSLFRSDFCGNGMDPARSRNFVVLVVHGKRRGQLSPSRT